MAVRMMVNREEAESLGLDHPDIEVVHNYPGAESGMVCHHLECPNCPEEDKAKARHGWNHEKHPQEEYPIRENCDSRCRVTEPLYMRTTYRGCVLGTGEHNMRDDSDFYAVVWNEETQSIIHVEYATTRGWSYPNGAVVDATDEVKAKANAYLKVQAKAAWDRKNQEEAATPAKGKRLRVVKGRKIKIGVEGECFWYGKGRKYSMSRWAKDPMRVGFKTDEGETLWTDASNVEVINPEQYLRPDDSFYFRPPYGEGDGASYRVGVQVGNMVLPLN